MYWTLISLFAVLVSGATRSLTLQNIWSFAPEVNFTMGRLKNPMVVTVLLLVALMWGSSALGIVALGGGANFLFGIVIGVLLLMVPYRVLQPRLGWLLAPVYMVALLLVNVLINFPVLPAAGVIMHVVFYMLAFVANALPDRLLNRPLETRHD